MSLESMREKSRELFAKAFGSRARWTVAAPGRVNLIGEHTDYNEGYVLPMAIERFVVISGNRVAEREVTLHSITTGDTASFSIKATVERGEPSWSNYVRGVVAGFQQRGARLPGFQAIIESSLPYGGGLASSAALEVATATLIECIRGETLAPLDKALLCQHAEHDFAGVPCGIMDQFTSILGVENHALLLDCRTRNVTRVPLDDPAVTVLIVNTQKRHRLAEGEYAIRRKQCERATLALGVASLRDVTRPELEKAKAKLDPVIYRRARHVVTENERTLAAAEAIKGRDWSAVGDLMYASHKSLKDDYEVSAPELDVVVGIARELGRANGVIGCRMTGAGFGGCAVSLVHTDAVQRLTRKFAELYEQKTDEQPMIFSSRPAGGARLLD